MEAIPVSWVKRCNNTMDQPIATASTQSLVAPASQLAQPNTSHLETSVLQMHTRPNTLYSETSALQMHGSDLLPLAAGDIVTSVPSRGHDYNSPFSVVWAKALQITKKKLGDNSLPPLDLTNITSQSAEENIRAVVRALNISQEDKKKKRWSYTWRGREVIVVERLGKILRSVEKYSKVVDTAIQTSPQVSALVWAGVSAIMRVKYSV